MSSILISNMSPIYIFIFLPILSHQAENTIKDAKCKVSGIRHTCSSAFSIRFDWTLNYNSIESCTMFLYRIKSNTTSPIINVVNLLNEGHVVQGLQMGETYKSVFMQYLHDNKTQVSGSYKSKITTTHESGPVESLRMENITTSSAYVKWDFPADAMHCVSYFQLDWCETLGPTDICSSAAVRANMKYIADLAPCTSYTVHVIPVDIDNWPASQSRVLTFSTMSSNPAPVSNVNVMEVTYDSISVSWDEPHSTTCINGYTVSISNISQSIVSQETIPTYRKSFTFTGLKQCSLYYITVEPSTSTRANHVSLARAQATTSMSSDVTVEGLSMTTTWTSLELRWSLPPSHSACEPTYSLLICDPSDCRGWVTTNATRYTLGGLVPCTEYSVLVAIKVSPSQNSRTATVAQLTRGKEPMQSDGWQLDAFPTSNSIFVQWGFMNLPTSCAKELVINALENGSIIFQDRIAASNRGYTISNLTSCQRYALELTVVDHSGLNILKYKSIIVTTQIAENARITTLHVDDASFHYMRLLWSLDPQNKNCQPAFKVHLSFTDGSNYQPFITAESYVTWRGSVCTLQSVSVQIEHRGSFQVPAVINLFETFRNTSGSSLEVKNNARNAVILVRPSSPSKIVCSSELWYNISWHNDRRVDVATSPLTRFQDWTKVEDLFPCTQYTASVHFWHGNRELHTFNSSITTNYEEPELVLKVETFRRGLNVSWETTRTVTKYCLDVVKVNIEVDAQVVRETNVTELSSVTFNNLVPCRAYSVVLYGLGKFQRPVVTKSLQAEIPSELFPALTPVVRKLTNHSVELHWNMISPEFNDCYMTKFQVQCHTSSDKLTTYSPSNIEDYFIVVVVDKLTANTNYKCKALVTNQAGTSEVSDVDFTTKEGIPSEPKNVTVEVVSSSYVKVRWDPPDFMHGSLTNYTVVIDDQKLLYSQALGCLPTQLKPQHILVNSTRLELRDLAANLHFRVRVMAATKAGHGPPSAPVIHSTPVGDSDPVENLNVTVTLNETHINWEPPCLTRGPLSGFIVSLNGSRPGHQVSNYSWNLPVGEVLSDNYNLVTPTNNLTAEAMYRVTVTPIGRIDNTGLVEVKTFRVPPRIPASPSLLVPLPEVQVSGATVVFTFRSDLFPDTEGTVVYYSILVAENFPHPPAQGWLQNSSWPDTDTWAEAMSKRTIPPYQATPMYWEPFKGMPASPFAVKQFELGIEACPVDEDIYCNGPLRSDTLFELRIRAFTLTGYRDSSTVTFATSSPTYLRTTAILTSVMLTLVAVSLIFGYITTKSHINKLKETKENLNKKLIANGDENIPESRKALSFAAFLLHCDNILTSTDCLAAEYTKLNVLSAKNNATNLIAKLPHNTMKNRYTDIAPYDYNRVILEADENKDYINASHVKFQEVRSIHYIACQGPPKTECESFWQMVIQYKVNAIVMLCKPIEKDKEKCHVYYPKLREALTFGNITAYCKNEEEYPYHIVRSITVEKCGEMREVIQFHFQTWPDREVPESPDLIVELSEAVRRVVKQKSSVIAVHCSAGVGRTGTFIAVDVLLRELCRSRGCKINVLDTVLTLREQRCRMVQTQIQYEYIYKCLKYAMDKDKSLSSKVARFLAKRASSGKQCAVSQKEIQPVQELSEFSSEGNLNS